MNHATHQSSRILEPLVSSSPPACDTSDRRSSPQPPRHHPAWVSRASEGESGTDRCDPVSGLALVSLAHLEHNAHYRRALAPVLRAPPRAAPNGLVHSLLNDAAGDRAGQCPVIFYVSEVDLVVSSPKTSAASAEHDVTTVTAYVVLSRPFLSLWSATGELHAITAVHHLTSVTRCASNVLLLRRLPTDTVRASSSPPSSSSNQVTSSCGTDLAFVLAESQETDFFLATLTRVAQLPAQLDQDASWLRDHTAAAGSALPTVSAVPPPLSLPQRAPHMPLLACPWMVCERPYTHLLALTNHTQLLARSARVSVTRAVVDRAVPWLSAAVADALAPSRLFHTFIADQANAKSTSVTHSPTREVRFGEDNSPQRGAGLTRPVRSALAMLQLGTLPRTLSDTTQTAKSEIAIPSHRDDGASDGAEKWYFCFPEHHEASTLIDNSSDEDAPPDATPSPRLHDDEHVAYDDDDEEEENLGDAPDHGAVMALLSRMRSQQAALDALMHDQGKVITATAHGVSTQPRR